jgi:ABC-2 type transport system ATP-binding protein
MKAIVADGLTKIYGTQHAVDDLSFEVPFDRVTGFLGPNGAGKTTTMRMLLGLVHPSAGEGRILGRRYGELVVPGAAVGALLETQQFHPLRTARNHLRAYAAVAGAGPGRIEEVLDLVDLTAAAEKKVGQFSLGMRQRLGLAVALLTDPRVLVMDEPGNGLDPSGIRWLRNFLRGFATDGRAVFVSSHLLAEMTQMADEVLLIDKGRLVVHASVTELVSHGDRAIHVRTDDAERLRDLLIAAGRRAELTAHDNLVVTGSTPEEVGRMAAGAGIPIFKLDAEEGTLEDVFLELTGPEAIV